MSIILLLLAGVGVGLFAGIVPGMHINTLIPILMSLSIFLNLDPYEIVVLIVATGMSEIFFNFIPSIFIGAPDADTALSVLPGHRLLLEGKGYEAILLTVIGGVGAILSSLLFISIFASAFQFLYEISRPYIHFAISAVVIFMIFSEKKMPKIISAFVIIMLSGFLGIFVLNSPLLPVQHSLFPIFTGLFGLSTLIMSISQRSSIPEQNDFAEIGITKKEIIKSVLLGSVAGIIVGFLPAIGISEAATMVQYAAGMGEARSFLVTISSINVGNEIFSLTSLYLVGNPRSGVSVAIEQILTELTFFDVMLFIGIICVSASIAAVLTLYLGRKLPKLLMKINYKLLISSVIVFITSMVIFFTGILGLLVLFTATAIGMLCVHLEIRRSHCMGVLLISTILFFADLNPLVISSLGI